MQSFSLDIQGKKHLQNVREMTVSRVRVYVRHSGLKLTGLICTGIKTPACLCCQPPVPTWLSPPSLVSQLLFFLRKSKMSGVLIKRQTCISPCPPALQPWVTNPPFNCILARTKASCTKREAKLVQQFLLFYLASLFWYNAMNNSQMGKKNPSLLILLSRKLMLITGGFTEAHNLKKVENVVTFPPFHLALVWTDRSSLILPQKLMSACNSKWKRNMNWKRAALWFLIAAVVRETASPSMDGMGSDQLLPPRAGSLTSQGCTEQIRNKTE